MYKDMTNMFQDKKEGSFSIENFEIRDDDFYAITHHIPSGKFVRLMKDGEVVMSNTRMEQITNRDFVEQAHGDVLIGGLGIGMIILAIQDKPEVESILVIEKYNEVINLVKSQLPLNDKVTILCEDIFECIPMKKFNTIYIDIWGDITTDTYEKEMKPLIRKYRKYLVTKEEDPNRYIDCWCKRQAKNGERI